MSVTAVNPNNFVLTDDGQVINLSEVSRLVVDRTKLVIYLRSGQPITLSYLSAFDAQAQMDQWTDMLTTAGALTAITPVTSDPVLVAVTPDTAAVGDLPVTLTVVGRNFTLAAGANVTVSFPNAMAGTTFVNSTTLTVYVGVEGPQPDPGAYDVIYNDSNGKTSTLAGAFTLTS